MSSAPPIGQEIEAKFAVPDARLLARLSGEPTLAGMRLSPPTTVEVHDTYLDTEDGAVAAAGYAWRVREADGRETTTLKALAVTTGPVHRREEIEVPMFGSPDGWPDGTAKELARRIIGDAALHPLVALTQHRTSRMIRKSRRTVAVMSLDEVTAHAGTYTDQYCEVEVELGRRGTEADLSALVACLRDEWGLIPESRSKYARAMALLHRSPRLLTDSEQAACSSLAHRPDLHGRRARALISLDQGATQIEAGKVAQMSARWVRHWLASFRARRMRVFPPRVLASIDVPAEKPTASTASPAPAIAAPSLSAPTVLGVSGGAGISRDQTMAEAAYRILALHFHRMRAHEAGTRRDEDPEELHDMRVATRRMRAAFLVFEGALDPAKVAHLRKGLRRTGRALGAVRDLDVFWQKTARYLATLPPERQDELASIRTAWEGERASARARLRDHLDGGRYAQTVEEFEAFFQTPGAAERHPIAESGMARPRRVSHVLPAILYERLAAVRAFDEWLTGAATPLPRLHRVRIAAKALRYALEFFAEVLGDEVGGLIYQMKRLQDHLGDIQDDVVAITVLRDFLT